MVVLETATPLEPEPGVEEGALELTAREELRL